MGEEKEQPLELDPRIFKGVEEFNSGFFFECHESLEEIWLEERGESRVFYQGLIQVASGYLKWEQGVLRGAIKLMHAGLEKLRAYPSGYLGVDLVSFLDGVQSNLSRIEEAQVRGQPPPELCIPLLTVQGEEEGQ